ncbi:hypothetical protein POF50_002280 [Streptomyces sp. SL13]|uniref:Proline--tRNA ligase n=1 Tax=Streptantibioticus silvisoli TaxID=2705255 RepID=A0AA90GZG5_9ACTN|nr:hypothetical protein [Streptantibioticus silvisoli]MDI5968183.1 hypothetical protein [Streptantibioticus silvisoli]
MAVPSYLRVLQGAGFLAGAPVIKGIPIWQGPGIQAVRLILERYVDLVAARDEPTVVTHPFLSSATVNRSVFGAYDNVYEVLDAPGHPDAQFRSDNIATVVPRLLEERSSSPVVSVGEVIRDAPGKTPPMFRDRNVWPVVELNQLAGDTDGRELLDFYAQVVTELLRSMGIPCLTVETPAMAEYGKTSYVTVGVLPSRRPTVLATLYILNDRLRLALGADQDVIDIGFTGKMLAMTAMLHADSRGLVLPSAIAPVQVGVTVGPKAPPERYDRWLADLRRAGLRCATRVARTPGARTRAEHAWHRAGVPLVIGLDREPGSVVACTRLPLTREALPDLPGPARLRALLAAGDGRLADRAQRVFDTGMARGEHLRSMCRPCADALGLAVFGTLAPQAAVPCERCGDPLGERLFISEEGRFY